MLSVSRQMISTNVCPGVCRLASRTHQVVKKFAQLTVKAQPHGARIQRNAKLNVCSWIHALTHRTNHVLDIVQLNVNMQLIKKNVILAVWIHANTDHHQLVKNNATLNVKTHLITTSVYMVV